MTGNRWGLSLLIFLFLFATPLASAHAVTNIYLYDQSVVDEVNLGAYLADGTLQRPNGNGFFKYVDKGPAPAEYPTIAIADNSFEQLGMSNAEIDGVWFINHGNFYVPNKRALVLWMVRIPNATMRTASEFQEDLTISLWVDWNQDNAWKPGEQMIHHSFNLANRLPATHDDILVFYLTSFVVPDVTEILTSSAKYGNSGKDIRHLWVRAVVACDDADMSPDGAQLFGEYEDYRVSYYVQKKFITDSTTGGSR